MTDQQLLENIGEIVAKQLAHVEQDIRSMKRDLKSVKETVEEHTVDLFVVKGILEGHTKEMLNIKRNVRRSNKTLNIVALRYDERIVQSLRDINQS